MSVLSDIELGKIGKIFSINATGKLKERLIALGLTKDLQVEVIRKGPKNNLTVYNIRGVMIALRREEASLINVY